MLDEERLRVHEQQFIQTATLRPLDEMQAARERIKLWHWRARQLALERQRMAWPPSGASPEGVSDLRTQGLATLDGIVRATARILREKGDLDESIDDDFVAKGKPYRELSDDDASELLSIAAQRHQPLNWLCGLALEKDWDAVPVET